MDATVIISAVGLLFAAVAAWSAWMTVRLTRQLRDEASLQRMIEALVAVRFAAEDLAAKRSDFERQDRFRAAQRQLMLAGVLRFTALAFIAEIRELPGLFASVTANDASERPEQVASAATRIVGILGQRPPATFIQRCWLRVQWIGVRLRHPRSWRELRRGYSSGSDASE